MPGKGRGIMAKPPRPELTGVIPGKGRGTMAKPPRPEPAEVIPGKGRGIMAKPPRPEPAEGTQTQPRESPAADGGTEPISVFLLDDHELVRRGLRDLLSEETDIEVVGEAGQVTGAEEMILAARPHVAVLDARLPDGSGIEVCRHVRSRDPRIACLILTSYNDDDALFTAIMAGAGGYVLKQIRGTELVDAVRVVASGKSLLDPAVVPRVVERLRHQATQDDQLAGLTEQERRILALIADGLTNRQIAGRMFLAEKTVKNYVSSLLAKLSLESRTQAAVFATKLGS
jgi:two-component system response regulator DevR